MITGWDHEKRVAMHAHNGSLLTHVHTMHIVTSDHANVCTHTIQVKKGSYTLVCNPLYFTVVHMLCMGVHVVYATYALVLLYTAM